MVAMTVSQSQLELEFIMDTNPHQLLVKHSTEGSCYWLQGLVLFTQTANWEKYGGLRAHLENEFLVVNVSVYPKDLEEAYLRLQSYKDPNRDQKVRAQRPNKTSSPNEDDPDGPRVSFAPTYGSSPSSVTVYTVVTYTST